MRQVNFRMRARRLALIDRAALNAWNCNPVKRSVNLAPQSTCQLVSCRVNKCTLDARDFWLLARRNNALWQAPHKAEQRSQESKGPADHVCCGTGH